MSNDVAEVYRGHFDECLKHLGRTIRAQKPKGSKGAERVLQPIAGFCHAVPSSIKNWLFEPDQVPSGSPMIRMMFYLDLLGYKVIELEKMQSGTKRLAELIGYTIVTAEVATAFIGYSSISTLYKVLQGDQNPCAEKMEKIRVLCKKYMNELNEKKRTAKETYPLAISLSAQRVITSPEVTTIPNATMLIMQGLLGLLDDTLLKTVTESDLGNMQESHRDTILQLATRFDTLRVTLKPPHIGVAPEILEHAVAS